MTLQVGHLLISQVDMVVAKMVRFVIIVRLSEKMNVPKTEHLLPLFCMQEIIMQTDLRGRDLIGDLDFSNFPV